MKKLLVNLKVLSFLITGAMSFTPKNSKAHKESWIYFDLGDTVVNTKNDKGIDYFAGTKDYIDELKERGFKVGIISNIPETFGMDYDQKLKTLKEYISKNWIGHEEFDWTVFDEIFLPLSNNELKPADILYLRAMKRASFCKMAYISENIVEVEKANAMGIAGFHFNEAESELYIPMNSVREYLDERYTNSVPHDCL